VMFSVQVLGSFLLGLLPIGFEVHCALLYEKPLNMSM